MSPVVTQLNENDGEHVSERRLVDILFRPVSFYRHVRPTRVQIYLHAPCQSAGLEDILFGAVSIYREERLKRIHI